MTRPERPGHLCRCGGPAPAEGELCTGCFGKLVASHVNEALVMARSGRQVRIVVTTPMGTRVFTRAARRG